MCHPSRRFQHVLKVICSYYDADLAWLNLKRSSSHDSPVDVSKGLTLQPGGHSATGKQTFHVSIILSYRRITSECFYIKSTIYMTRYSVFLQHRCNRTAARSVKVLPYCAPVKKQNPPESASAEIYQRKKQTEVLCERKNIKGLHIKGQRCSNSDLNYSPVLWGWSSWEETFSQSYDCKVEFTERRREERQTGEKPDSIICLCEEVRRSGGVRAMKINHYPLENENLACQLWVELWKRGNDNRYQQQKAANLILFLRVNSV